MNKDFYEICKSVVGKLELTKEQGIARDVILNMLDMKEEESKDYLTRINKAIECIKNIKPLSLEETALKESIKQAYYESSHIKNCKESFDMVCHLEDFEIAMWNILEILGGDVDDE